MERNFLHIARKKICNKATVAGATTALVIFMTGLTVFASPATTENIPTFSKMDRGVQKDVPQTNTSPVTTAPIQSHDGTVDLQIKTLIQEQVEEFLDEKKESIEYLGQQIANDALSYVGWLPYVWAGASLESGVDCSGFTMALYAKYGYSLSHDSNVQSNQGTSVSLSEALPGDIIVYAGHVALYIGDGQVVHAPQPGQYVSLADVNMMPVLDVRRIIGN